MTSGDAKVDAVKAEMTQTLIAQNVHHYLAPRGVLEQVTSESSGDA